MKFLSKNVSRWLFRPDPEPPNLGSSGFNRIRIHNAKFIVKNLQNSSLARLSTQKSLNQKILSVPSVPVPIFVKYGGEVNVLSAFGKQKFH